ncbi:NAD(P)H-dependent oxidoreductase [Ruminococcus sp. JE7B6]|uniref:NAD(P)H-dependent oxidoreductase n=1 Tax=Ruminococcus sp. JE7B6 TaxID=3233380 RepID=UPI00292D2901|nr:NAD(P)H-dependent oxidoreductase [uncultured Ruminococcus sp.]
MTLYINCCVREESRTERLAQAVLQKLGGDFTELNLYNENLKPLDGEMLNKRTALIEQGDYSDPMFDYAKQFASADTIVIAAPYWDLSFPASLKTYIENIYVTGIVSAYNESGLPVGLCKATELYYVTTAGGPYDPTYSYGYIESLAKNFFGIPETHLVKAEMLDIIGNNAEEILNQEVSRILGNAIL